MRGLDPDEPPALAALAAVDVRTEVVDWDDPGVDWASYDRVVLRSTWDYDERLAEFLRWVERVAAVTDLRNPAAMVRWSSDKHYVGELEAAGVPVIPTTVVSPGEEPSFPAGGVVVKPAVGAGGRDVAVFPDDHARAAAHVARLHAVGDSALVQPLLPSVAVEGEWPMVYFGGRFSHAASKRVTLPSDRPTGEPLASETLAPHVADEAQLAVGDAAIAVVVERFGVPTYARVDLVRDGDGRPCVLELELVEPSLFLPEGGADAVARLVAALTAR